VIIGLSSCAQSPVPTSLDSHLHEIRSESKSIHPKRKFTAAENAYVAHYGLNQAEVVDHRFGYCDRGDFKIALHWYEPPVPQRVVVVSHGYYDHTGTWKHAIPALLAAGNTVVIYDHPGHGLSNGKRASIDDFRHYVDVLEDVLDDCQRRSRLPIVLAGHSMGCAVITDYLLDRDRSFKPSQTVFLAPLVRPSAWGPSKFGQTALAGALSSVPRVFTRNSSDPSYLEFVKQDPLHHRDVPLDWIRALVAWNQRASDFAPAEGLPIRILQGARDGTVAWKYNLEFLGRKFPDATVRIFADGKHQLLNEAEPLRSEVVQELVDAAGRSPSP
jgi:alpha-beta hydrolase superfamily lysophospholipase